MHKCNILHHQEWLADRIKQVSLCPFSIFNLFARHTTSTQNEVYNQLSTRGHTFTSQEAPPKKSRVHQSKLFNKNFVKTSSTFSAKISWKRFFDRHFIHLLQKFRENNFGGIFKFSRSLLVLLDRLCTCAHDWPNVPLESLKICITKHLFSILKLLVSFKLRAKILDLVLESLRLTEHK